MKALPKLERKKRKPATEELDDRPIAKKTKIIPTQVNSPVITKPNIYLIFSVSDYNKTKALVKCFVLFTGYLRAGKNDCFVLLNFI